MHVPNQAVCLEVAEHDFAALTCCTNSWPSIRTKRCNHLQEAANQAGNSQGKAVLQLAGTQLAFTDTEHGVSALRPP